MILSQSKASSFYRKMFKFFKYSAVHFEFEGIKVNTIVSFFSDEKIKKHNTCH